ncbi:MAG: MAPEG family protein [Deltaproteobacteria bacterium]|nr:MAPEG family protein [Deltaproteobacteria bacterium]
MTTPLWCLVIVALLPYVLSFSGGYFRMRQLGGIDNKHPRLQAMKLEGAGARAYAAQANAWEALGFFTAAVVVLHLANPEAARGATAANLSLGFLATRIVHPIAYLANLDVLRSLAFLAGLACGIGLLWLA